MGEERGQARRCRADQTGRLDAVRPRPKHAAVETVGNAGASKVVRSTVGTRTDNLRSTDAPLERADRTWKRPPNTLAWRTGPRAFSDHRKRFYDLLERSRWKSRRNARSSTNVKDPRAAPRRQDGPWMSRARLTTGGVEKVGGWPGIFIRWREGTGRMQQHHLLVVES